MPDARKARHGEAAEWVQTVALSDTDECIRWPFKAARGRMRGVSSEVVAEIGRLSSSTGYKAIARRLGVTFDAARYHARRARKAVAQDA